MAKRVKQGHLDGMEPETVQVVDEAAETYYERMQERVKHTNLESEAKDNLLERMKENGLTRYETPHFTVEVTQRSKVTVKPKKDAEDNGNDNDEE